MIICELWTSIKFLNFKTSLVIAPLLPWPHSRERHYDALLTKIDMWITSEKWSKNAWQYLKNCYRSMWRLHDWLLALLNKQSKLDTDPNLLHQTNMLEIQKCSSNWNKLTILIGKLRFTQFRTRIHRNRSLAVLCLRNLLILIDILL